MFQAKRTQYYYILILRYTKTNNDFFVIYTL